MKTFCIVKYFLIACTLLLFLFGGIVNGQNRTEAIHKQLEGIVSQNAGLNNPVDLSVDGISVQEFLKGLAMNNDINISINDGVNEILSTNFTGVKVIDVITFICVQYNLELDFIGNIIIIKRMKPEEKKTEPYKAKIPEINWNEADSTLSCDLNGDTLNYVVKAITQKSGINVIASPELRNKALHAYLKNVPIQQAMDKIAYANGFVCTKSGKGYIELAASLPVANNDNKNKGKGNKNNEENNPDLEVVLNPDSSLNINANNQNVADIINEMSRKSNVPCFILGDIKEKTSLSLKSMPFRKVLDGLLSGTSFSYNYQGGTYIIGDNNNAMLKGCEVVQLQHRTVIELTKSIPDVLKQNITIQEFPELNSIILCGVSKNVSTLKDFILQLDKSVPQVLIEVIIVEQNTNHSVKTGIKAGLKDKPDATSGQIYPGIDMKLDANAINSIISGINSFGVVNLGKVTPSFYVSLSALESNGNINIHSTPRLSTLNSMEAKMIIGNTEYYLEETNNVIGSQNPQNIITNQYKSVEAQFSLTIKPIVQGDDQITLKITVEQSDFTTRISQSAPPGKVTRTFNSTIRVKNQEMILLGGLEEKTTTDNGDGLPVISRIPVLKWFVSSRMKEKSKKKLNIFIKPTIIY